MKILIIEDDAETAAYIAILQGWSGDRDSYQAYGAMIRADIEGEVDGERMTTSQLTCDVTFDADFSLESEMRIEGRQGEDGYEGRLMGLCFGRKGDQDFHAVMLHPKGFLDIASNRGGIWEIHDHRSVPVEANKWHRLRIDVTGRNLDVYMDGLYVRSLEFSNAATVRGGFGLITGAGRADYRYLRLLTHDRHDPAARIERDLAMQKVMGDAGLRQAGNFTGIAPPALEASWHQGDGISLEQLRGRPVLLVFWSPSQDQVIPCTEYIAHLLRKGAGTDLETVVVCDGGTNQDELLAYVKEHPMTGARIGIDSGSTYEQYNIKIDGFGIPRILLLDRDGKVVFEGDPGLRQGVGWSPSQGSTYVDDAFDRLLNR